ncbi:MAG TPA: SpoIIE family protein phosphatase [Leptospiraceae bacterium]|nr:SpoIIE family protein phosphatase [Leptospiraceae bacterium]HMW03835.1 SpoIIE family protein phosphatase [Leptospiraceae bacterium]HMX32884.1 SpoIIE family protein phosphatase [Leptospiraceae bacterium]HMY29815.1 SpoIIE family protein phosphatase [Leptospiraceae bacterium]HMZ65203.1 SpoIIE family protein phosphatase [Leptospiraceae bacterium]
MSIFSSIESYSRNVKIRTKMIILISGVVLISVLPLSLIVLYRNQAVVLNKTFEVCSNLAQNISNLATEELLMNETYDTTRTSIKRLKDSNISGLLESYVVNVDGKYVADLNEQRIDQQISDSDKGYFKKLEKLEMKEINSNSNQPILRFSYPIFITEYETKEIRKVGIAVFEFDKKKVYEPVVQIRTTIIGVAGVLFIVGIIIAAYAAFAFSKPIQKLSEGAQKIGGGDLNHRIKLTGSDELGQLAKSFNLMTSQIQDFTQNLELKVAQRTEELNRTLQEVQALKIAQDGDYYLTSILLNPLQPNNNRSSKVKTEFMIEQKKKFSFRKWHSQIGGDICITDTITLNGKEYTVFINGDAMGKSIQGAGGALVLGVVFNAGLIRSRIEKFQSTYPEIWLKERFLDLHNVFLSFDGSMYISICLGLIDNSTGLLYYINAEHPWTVLYRDGKASFLEQELALRKIGTPDQEDQFYVRMFQLMPGDVVITGSDGRDDLVLKNKEGIEYIQEDESQFLLRVEEGEGKIAQIAQRVKETGALMDDFSLLRISFNEEYAELENTKEIPYHVTESVSAGMELLEEGNAEEAIKKVEQFLHDYNDFPDMLKLLGKVYFQKGDFPKAIECFEQYLTLNPSDNEYLYALSNTYRVYGKLNLAADIAERLFLRDQKHLLNLINLATIYYGLRVFGRAESMIKRALYIDPENKHAELLYESIREAIIEKSSNNNGQVKKLTLSERLKAENENLLEQAEELYKNKDYQGALILYQQLLDDENSENSRILLKIANCNSFLNKLDQAIIFYDRALKTDPMNYHAHNNLGGIYFKQGLYLKAKNQWMKSLEIKTDFKPAEINLQRLEKMESKLS